MLVTDALYRNVLGHTLSYNTRTVRQKREEMRRMMDLQSPGVYGASVLVLLRAGRSSPTLGPTLKNSLAQQTSSLGCKSSSVEIFALFSSTVASGAY